MRPDTRIRKEKRMRGLIIFWLNSSCSPKMDILSKTPKKKNKKRIRAVGACGISSCIPKK